MRGGISQFLILFWQWISINAFVGPQESAWLLKNTFGSCEWFQNVYELGVFGGEPAQHGLVAQNLHFLAHTDYANGSRLFTLEYPHVLIISATIVCASRALLIDHYSTLTLRIQYSCRGVACGQEPSDVKYRQYTHLFSFACTVDGTRYTTLDHFMKHPYINRSEQLIDDHGSGVLTSYPCRLCSVDPNIRNSPHTGPRFRPETGCVECASNCLESGLQSCTTSVNGNDSTCCISWYNRRCASTCPATHYRSHETLHVCALIDRARITSLVPNHPSVTLTTSSPIPTYQVPLGFRGTVVTCNAKQKPLPPRVEWLVEDDYTINIVTSSLHHHASPGLHTAQTSTGLQFRDGFSGFDVGRYYCVTGEEGNQDVERQSVVIRLSTDYTMATGSDGGTPPCGIETNPIAHFQIRVLDIDNIQWEEMGVHDFKEEVRAEFSEAVIGAVALLCQNCFASPSSLLTVHVPTRSTQISTAAIFRGVINSTRGDQTKAILCALDTWAQSGPLTHIGGEFLLVDKSCNITSSSLDDKECPGTGTLSALSLAASTSGIWILFLVLSIAVIAIAILAIHRSHEKRKERKEKEHEPPEATPHVSVYQGSMYEDNDDRVTVLKEYYYLDISKYKNISLV